MKYYIATSLSRAIAHNRLRDSLNSLKYEIAYDWTSHGSVKSVSLKRLQEVAVCELNGILQSDFVVVLLPGGHGTHLEMGFALGQGKKIFLHSEEPSLFELGSQTNAFYHHPNLIRLCCPLADVAVRVHTELMAACAAV